LKLYEYETDFLMLINYITWRTGWWLPILSVAPEHFLRKKLFIKINLRLIHISGSFKDHSVEECPENMQYCLCLHCIQGHQLLTSVIETQLIFFISHGLYVGSLLLKTKTL
jgi:hypothetical protein